MNYPHITRTQVDKIPPKNGRFAIFLFLGLGLPHKIIIVIELSVFGEAAKIIMLSIFRKTPRPQVMTR